MTRVSVELLGEQQLQAALAKFAKEAQGEIDKAVTSAGIELRSIIVKGYQKGPKTGKVYTRGTVDHQSSAPGEAPATDTGRLVNSVYFEKTQRAVVAVGSMVVYGEYLEWGTRKIAPRPLWRPSVEKIKSKFRNRIEIAIKKAAK